MRKQFAGPGTILRTLIVIMLVQCLCIQSAFADLIGTDTLNWVVTDDPPNPYKFTVGSGRNTPSGFPGHTLTVQEGATIFPTGNNAAISVSDDWTINIEGLVQNQANGNGGLWNAGPNTIEASSNTTIVVGGIDNRVAQVLATGNQSNGEAINLIGNNNQIQNYGLIQSRTGAAIWFQDTEYAGAYSNTIDNYGTIRTLKGSNASAIGNSGNNGVVFNNHEGAHVDGGLSFAGGDDLLTFYAGSTVTGSIDGGGGTNSLVLQGKEGSSDSLAGALRNFTTLTKTGEGDWTITGSLSGFTKASIVEGTLRLTGNNTGYNGSVIVNSSGYFTDAVLEAKARSLPTTGTNIGNITNDGILRLVDSLTDDDGGVGHYAGQITGTGRVEMTGTGIVTLENTNNTYEGGTYVKNGTLKVLSDDTLGAADGEIVLGDGTIGRPSTSGTLQFGAAFDLGSGRSIRTEGAGGIFDTDGFDSTISTAITGGTVTKAGEGTLTLTGENTYAGGTYITGGTLQVGDGGTEGSIPYAGILSITDAGAALAINKSNAVGNEVNIPTRITGAGKFIQRGTGTTTLAGTNTYAGGTDIENGTLAVQSNLNLGTGGLAFGTAATGGTLLMTGIVALDGRDVTLNGGGGTIDTNGFRGSASGVISGTGGLTKAGDGVLTLTANSTYTGGTTISGGAVQLGDGGASGGIVGNVANDGTLIFNRSDDVDSLALAGAISGAGNLVQRGAGTTTLSGGNSYGGGTAIENGTLAVNADAALGAATGGLTFGTATTMGTLKVTADIDDLADDRDVTINTGGGTIDTDGHHVTSDADMDGDGDLIKKGAGTLTLTGASTYTGGTTVEEGDLELGAGGTSGSILGNVEVQGTGTVIYNRSDNTTNPAGLVSGTGNVIQRGGGTTTITNDNTYTGSTTLENGTLAISKDANLGLVDPGIADSGHVIFAGGKLQLDDNMTLGSKRAVTLQSSGTIDTLGNTGTIGSVIDGAGTLTKDGSGTLVLTGENTYTGNTAVAAGTLAIGDGGTTGRILGDVANSGEVVFNRDGTVTYSGVISGAGNVIQQGGNSGNGDTIFTGDHSYTGDTSIVSGTLQLGDGGTSGSITGDVKSKGTLAFNRSDEVTYAGVVSGDGNLVQKGTGTTVLTGTNTYKGGTLISAGALQLGNDDPLKNGTITGDVTNNSMLIFNNAVDESFAGEISGTGSLVKDGENVLTLTADNTFTGGTELRRGGILMTNAGSLETTNGNGNLAGHVLYSTIGADTKRTFEVDASVATIQNHFHVVAGGVVAGSKNIFQTNGDLSIAGVVNNSTQQSSGGAFYVAGGSYLDINVGQAGQSDVDLVLKDNYSGGNLNDIHIEQHGTVNLNVAGVAGNSAGNAVFINSGIGGQGILNVNGSGIAQIAAGSRAGQTTVTGTVMRLVESARFTNASYNQDSLSALQGNGTLAATGGITIGGSINPDSDTLDTDRKTVNDADRIGTLTITGAPTTLDHFTYTYDVVAPNTAGVQTSNDLVKFGAQNVTITGGTVDFVTAGSAGLATGQYLVFDSTSAAYRNAQGAALTNGTLNQLLKGTVNGAGMTAGTPRIGYDFQLRDGTATNSQIWLDVERNTLQVVWQGGVGPWTPGNWQSKQINNDGSGNPVYANDFNDGDMAIFSNTMGDAAVTLTGDIIVSGLHLVKNSDAVINVKIDGDYGIGARETDATIEGDYANSTTDPQRFDTTGKLEIHGVYDNNLDILTTMTLANTGVNEFREGIDIYGGRIVVDGAADRLGTYGDVLGYTNAGLVTFKVPSDPEIQKHVVEVDLAQTLQNRFVVESTVRNAYIIANENATISGITNAAAIELQDDSFLTLQANGTAAIVLAGNGTTDVKMGESTQLTVTGTGNTFVRSGMQGATGSSLIKSDTGTLQIEVDSYADYISVDNGTVRVFEDKYLGSTATSSFYVAWDGQSGAGDPAFIAGAGTVRAESIDVRGHISPDSLDASDAATGSRYGTLTFDTMTSGAKLHFQNFTMDFDVAGPTIRENGTLPSPGNDTDLLNLAGMAATLDGGTVNFRTENNELFQRGDYLVVTSTHGYDMASLTATVNGQSVAGSPRGDMHFELRDSNYITNGEVGNEHDIWLVNELNSLSMNWTGQNGAVAAPAEGSWEFGIDRFKSAQDEAGAREAHFLNGDKVFVYNPGSDPLVVTLTRKLYEDAVDVTVSGLVVGRESGTGADDEGGAVHDGNVTITGLGSITADADSAFGKYVDPATGAPELIATGALQKYGSGGLIVSNTGGNKFLDGTELHNGSIAIGHHQALGAVDGAGTNLDGYVFFTGTDDVTRTVSVFPTDGTVPITNIKNHFRAVSTDGANVFEIDNALTISGVENKDASTQYGGAFYVGSGSNLTIDAGGDLTLFDNSYGVGAGLVDNDMYVEDELKFDVAAGKGVFVGSGVAGTAMGSIEIAGAGFVQVAAESEYYGGTTVKNGATFRVVEGATYGAADMLGVATGHFSLEGGADLEGNGTILAGYTELRGNISPDGKTKSAADKSNATGLGQYATLSIKGGDSGSMALLAGFSFDYDVKSVNDSGDGRLAGTPNDLLAITSMDSIALGEAAGTAGTINMHTDGNVGRLDAGKYLIIDADIGITSFGGASLNSLLAGSVDGTAFGAFSPRTGYDFRFNNATEASTANSQIWLDVSLNSLTMDWTGLGGPVVWNATDGNWRSLQTGGNGIARESVFRGGDKVHFSGNLDYTVELGGDVLVSGMVGGQNTAGMDGTGNVTISGDYGITARLPQATGETDIIGKYVGNTLAETGKLEKYGTGTMTLANTGTNFFEQGTDIYGGTIELAEAARLGEYTASITDDDGLVTFKNNDSTLAAVDNTAKTIVVDTEQILQNRFVVEQNVRNASITANANTEISGILGDAQSGAIRLEDNVNPAVSLLRVRASGGDITMTGNETSGNTGNDIYVGGQSTVSFFSGSDSGDIYHIFLDSGIAGLGSVQKYNAGILQIAADSDFSGVTNLSQGTFRVTGDRSAGTAIVYGDTVSAEFYAGIAAFETSTLAGGGIIEGKTIVIGNSDDSGAKAYVSPDSATLASGGTTVSDTEKYGTLTLSGDDSALTFSSVALADPAANDRSGFHFDYDVNASNTLQNGSIDPNAKLNTTNDLLKITGMESVNLEGGVVNFRTGTDGLKSGSYLVIDSDMAITDRLGDAFGDGTLGTTVLDGINDYTNRGGVLWGQINGNDIREGSPRRKLGYVLRNDDKQIWLDVDRNTLTMVRTQGGDWNGSETAQLWRSEQLNNVSGTDVYDYVIERGDYAKIYNPNAGSFTVTGSADQILSDLQLGNAGDAGDVIIAGDFGITAETADADGWIEGIYVNPGATGTPVVPVDGMLKKYGSNTATFANTGANEFEQGIELHGGTLSYNNANQLTVGANKELAFKETAALRADATAALDTDVSIADGKAATLEAGSRIGMLVSSEITGGVTSTLNKEGEGLVQLSADSAAFDGIANVNDGTLRILGGKTFGSADSALNVNGGGGTIAGAGTFKSGTIVVNGNISPDSLVDLVDGTRTGSEFGTLTLAGGVRLDGFVLEYDVNAPNTSAVPTATTNDLLRVAGDATLVGGIIALRSSKYAKLEDLEEGEYLIVSADRQITVANGKTLDGINSVTGVLAASYNGGAVSNATPRTELGLEFRDYDNVANSQIWLTKEDSTLQMNWNGGASDWGGGDSWTSWQTTLSGGREHAFRNGDFVYFSDTTGDSTANLTADVLVSGLDTSTGKTVLFTGAGGITAVKDDAGIIGKFAETDDNESLADQGFYTTGLFRQYGGGTVTFANDGTNLFEEGIELYNGTVSYNNASQLTVNNGKSLTFKGDATLRADATAALNPAVFVETAVTGTLFADSGVSMLMQDTVSGAGTLAKTGEGTVQLNASSLAFDGTARVEEGTLRILAGQTFGSDALTKDSALNVKRTGVFDQDGEQIGELVGTIAGAGTYKSETITVNGDIAPDTFAEDADGDIAGGKYGTLTLSAKKITLDDFVLRYDVNEVNTSNDPADTSNDLLATSGKTSLVYGMVDFQGTLAHGKYLVVDSDSAILGANGKALTWETLDGINFSGGALKAFNKGKDLSEGSPRAEYIYELADYSAAGSQIWLSVDRNTLTMTWNGGDGDWGKSNGWTSAQYKQTDPNDDDSKVYAHDIERGDYARIVNGAAGTSFTVTVTADQRVSGLELGGAGTVILDGGFGVTALTSDGDWIRGLYVDENAPMQPKVPVDGMLTKNGSGTATFANTGTNLFSEGIELYGGILSYGNANQLRVGDGKALTFTDNATLRADSVADLDTAVAIAAGKTGTLHADAGKAMLLREDVSGDGDLAKTGEGIVQLGVTSSIGGAATVEEGALRIVDGTTTFTAGKGVTVESSGALQGNGTVAGGAILVNGHISPDKAILTASDIGVSDADKFGTLTLAGSVNLDGFTFDYDLGTSYTLDDPSSDPTGDLLAIAAGPLGAVKLEGGVIAFSGKFDTGKYLIIDSDTAIDFGGRPVDGIEDADGLLTATLDGMAVANETPRGEHEFVTAEEDRQVWLVTEQNSLYMNWTGGAADWSDASWASEQKTLSGGRASVFRDGDFVAFASATDSDVNLVGDVVVSGLEANTSADVVITGEYGIEAIKENKPGKNDITGKYANGASDQEHRFDTTGMLVKAGAGTLTFANTGGNTFEKGIELYEGTTAFNQADQLAVGTDGALAFKGNSTLAANASLAYDTEIKVDDGVTGTFETEKEETVFNYDGVMDGSATAGVKKTGAGTMNLNDSSTSYLGSVDVAGGTLGVNADYGNATSFTVRNSATLTGSGTLGGIGEGGSVKSGGTVAPRGMSKFVDGDTPVRQTFLTVDGDVTFEKGSIFDVTIAQYDGGKEKLTPVSDLLKVDGGTVTIQSGALIRVNYWDASATDAYNEEQSGRFTVIDATGGTMEAPDPETGDLPETAWLGFTLSPDTSVPLGVRIVQGWEFYDAGWAEDGSDPYDAGWLYQLWFEKDPDHNFENLCDRHNRVEIGKNLDWLVNVIDPGMKELINHLSSSCFSDKDRCNLLDQLTGDLALNALMPRKPWRIPFRILDADLCADFSSRDEALANGSRPRLWAEAVGRHGDVDFDGNAHSFTIRGKGVALGFNYWLGNRVEAGVTFNYMDSRHKQSTGRTDIDDYEFGLYGRFDLGGGFDVKAYGGLSHQRYHLRRNVRIPECNNIAALDNRFDNRVSGYGVAASLEAGRVFELGRFTCLRPLVALDFEQLRMDGYAESGGLTALRYGDMSYTDLDFRVGVESRTAVARNLDLRARIQYERQLNKRDYSEGSVRFVNAATPGQRGARIRGVALGRDGLHLGAGLDWKVTHQLSVHANYDASIFENATTQNVELGISLRW